MSIEFAKRLLKLTVELEQTAAYWSEYDVPLGIHERIAEAKEDCLAEIDAEIKTLEYQADELVKFANHESARKPVDLLERSYVLREQAGLLRLWLVEALSDE